MEPPPPPSLSQRALTRWRNRLEAAAADHPVRLAFYVFLGVALIVIPLSLPFYLGNTVGFVENIMAEAHGMVFDLLVIGWFMFWLQRQGDRRLRANRYREEIDDFLGWRSTEAALRIAGNVRRLNRLGVSKQLKLTEAYLKGASLSGAELFEADLWGAELSGAILQGAQLDQANLAGADLQGANLERATLTKADLRGADLTEASLERAYLEGVDLRAATLTSCDLQFAALPMAKLERACLFRANLRGAHLERADLRRALLEEANLHGASLDGADLRGAQLEGADLERADLSGARLPHGKALLALFGGVKSLVGAKLDPTVEEALVNALPHLFGKPDLTTGRTVSG